MNFFTENAVLRNLDQNTYDICYKIDEFLRDYIIINTIEILYYMIYDVFEDNVYEARMRSAILIKEKKLFIRCFHLNYELQSSRHFPCQFSSHF